MSISNSNALPDVVSVQKKVYPLIFNDVVSIQETKQPIATVYGFKLTDEQPDDGSGWKQYQFTLDRWANEVVSHKLKTEVSTELLQDMKSMGIPSTVVEDNLADQLADDINKDILDALTKISSNGSDIYINDTESKFNQGRALYGEVGAAIAQIERDTGLKGSYVVAGGKAFELLLGSSYVTLRDGTNTYTMTNGVNLVHDKYSTSDYVIVGVKKSYETADTTDTDNESTNQNNLEISSLVFSSYTPDSKDMFSYQEDVDSNSLQPVYGVMARFAITAAPLEKDQRGVTELDWNDPLWEDPDPINWPSYANSSKLSVFHNIAF